MTRGAVYGNFKNKDELFPGVGRGAVETHHPATPTRRQPEGADEDIGKNGRTGGACAPAPRRGPRLPFQLYSLTHEQMRSAITEKNAVIYKRMAKELVKVIPAERTPDAGGTIRPRTGYDDHWLAILPTFKPRI